MQAPNFNFNLKLGRRGGADVVGLDIQPGHVAAVQAHVNGGISVKHAAEAAHSPGGLSAPPAPPPALPADIVREGEVLDEGVLAETLRELFKDGGLSRRVRLGVANQRTVLRTLDLPPVNDRKEIEAAVRFQAQDQVPMPLSNAVLDFHALGIVETPEGPRQRVVLVAAQRDMIQRLLAAVRDAGLRPEGVDLSAFALIRSLYRPDPEHSGRVLYLNVDGLTNMAIAEGTLCRFTRVVGGGIEAMASQLAERRSIPLVEARELIAVVDLTVQPVPEPLAQSVVAEAEAEIEPDSEPHIAVDPEAPTAIVDEAAPADAVAVVSVEDQDAREREMSYAEMAGVGQPLAESPEPDLAPPADDPPASSSAPALSSQTTPDADVRTVLENGIREIAGEVRNSLDFHRSQEGGGEVTRVVLSGAALDLPGFADALQEQLGIQVERESVHSDERQRGGISAHRLAIAAGLAVEEAPR
jgi:type IV pilus assembly protein PilM